MKIQGWGCAFIEYHPPLTRVRRRETSPKPRPCRSHLGRAYIEPQACRRQARMSLTAYSPRCDNRLAISNGPYRRSQKLVPVEVLMSWSYQILWSVREVCDEPRSRASPETVSCRKADNEVGTVSMAPLYLLPQSIYARYRVSTPSFNDPVWDRSMLRCCLER